MKGWKRRSFADVVADWIIRHPILLTLMSSVVGAMIGCWLIYGLLIPAIVQR